MEGAVVERDPPKDHPYRVWFNLVQCLRGEDLTWPLASEIIQNYLLSAKKTFGKINLFKNTPFLKFNHHFIVNNRCSVDYNKSISLILHVIYNTNNTDDNKDKKSLKIPKG